MAMSHIFVSSIGCASDCKGHYCERGEERASERKEEVDIEDFAESYMTRNLHFVSV
jgi:hypothetical protein